MFSHNRFSFGVDGTDGNLRAAQVVGSSGRGSAPPSRPNDLNSTTKITHSIFFHPSVSTFTSAAILSKNNVNAVLGDERSINLGSVYESVVAQELHAHGCELHYYDNKQRGEVDFLIDDYESLSVLPIEVKSGKDYKVHSALDSFMKTPDYNVRNAVVLHSGQKVYQENGITYLPIYYVMFLAGDSSDSADMVIPEIEPPRL